MATTLGWLLGASLILVGFWLTGFYFLSGVALALVGFLWWPPSRRFLVPRFLPPMLLLQAGLTLCLLVVALFAFIGRYSVLLEERALQAGYPSVEAWQEAQHQSEPLDSTQPEASDASQ